MLKSVATSNLAHKILEPLIYKLVHSYLTRRLALWITPKDFASYHHSLSIPSTSDLYSESNSSEIWRKGIYLKSSLVSKVSQSEMKWSLFHKEALLKMRIWRFSGLQGGWWLPIYHPKQRNIWRIMRKGDVNVSGIPVTYFSHREDVTSERENVF